MKIYMIATDEPLAARMDGMDEYGNPEPELLWLYRHRADAEKAVDQYNGELHGDAAWIVEVEVREKLEQTCAEKAIAAANKEMDRWEREDVALLNPSRPPSPSDQES